tara:strand:- start:1016 stop:1294 length:279 start_codon:yes stop_codon:yes gene_type:complete
MKITLDENDTWQNSHYVFELTPSDGTKYTVQVTPALYGGLNVICNESSLWRWHGEGDLKFLCGDDNEYTCRAIVRIMMHHDARMIEIEELKE